MGGQFETFCGLTGIGDLIVTCASMHSRNRRAGILIGQGKSADEAMAEVKMVVEGVYSAKAAMGLSKKYNVDLPIIAEVNKILFENKPLQDVGLGYIKLGQSSSTLSGGENQRVKLAYFIGQEKADPTLFIFDEPTTGLHFHDIQKLLHSFDSLIKRGHSILIIEHNMEVIKCADWVIDLGPDGGDKGGGLVFEGTPENLATCKESITGKYLADKLKEA